MRISNYSYTTTTTLYFFRYCLNCTPLSSLSPKTLNPNIHTPLLSNSLSKISSFCKSFSAFLPINNRFQINSSIDKIESNSRCKRQSLCYFQSGLPSKIRSSTPSVLHYFDSSTLLKRESHYRCSNSERLRFGRCFSIASSDETFTYSPVMESEVQNVANICSDQQKLEKKNIFPRKFVSEIVDILRNNGADLESRLSMLHSKLSIYSITEIFEVLNSRRISGLRLFEWIWINKPQLHKNARICSLIIDNFGRLDDYGNMSVWFKKFGSEKIYLTYEAFAFLPVLAPENSSLRESATRVVDLLNKIGGSFRSSGVCALVEMFCKLDLFEMAKYIIKITESKNSYYCILIREKCRSGLIEDAHSIIREMGNANCVPNTTVYNYLLGSLWKNGRMDKASALLDEMKEIGIPRDEITFEILINFVCRFGEMDEVHQLLDEMTSQGIEPRISTHACIVKTLFAAEKYEAAHKYVVDFSVIYKTSSNMMYSLMANLYWEKGDILSAKNILVEMMEKGLKPNFSIYLKIVKRIRRSGSTNLARDLESLHSKFAINYRA
ncbi:hypothetical protein ACP275_03G129700 [Erythranthe tilingii]